MALDIRLLSGEPVPGNFDDLGTVQEVRAAIAQVLKLSPARLSLIGSFGLLEDGDTLERETVVQVAVKELQMSTDELLKVAGFSTFDAMKQCSALRLCGSQLSTLPESFGEAAFKEVRLSRNHMYRLPDSLGQVKQMEELHVDHNQLMVLPDTFGCLVHLQHLALHRNQLHELPDNFGDLQALETVSLNNNQIKCFPATFWRLTQLKQLDISDNLLETLPSGIGDLMKLKTLVVTRNFLTALPTTVANLDALETLSVGLNLLQELPEVFSTLCNLKRLHLQGNQLQLLPPSLMMATSLVELMVNDNVLTALPDQIGNLHALKELNLSGNNLTALPYSFNGLEALQTVWLDALQMRALPLQSRAMLRVAATVVTSLEDDAVFPTGLRKAPSKEPLKPKTVKEDRTKHNFQHFDSDGDGLVSQSDLSQVLQQLGPVIGLAFTDEAVSSLISQIGTSCEGAIKYDDLTAWLSDTRPCMEKQLLRLAACIAQEHSQAALDKDVTRNVSQTLQQGVQVILGKETKIHKELSASLQPRLVRANTGDLRDELQVAYDSLRQQGLHGLCDLPNIPIDVRILFAVLELLCDGVPFNLSVSNKPAFQRAQDLMCRPCFMLELGEFCHWIDEGKVPEDNVQAAKLVRECMGVSFQPEYFLHFSQSAGILCRWLGAVIAYYDAVDTWEPW